MIKILFALLVSTSTLLANTNILILTWNEPPGFKSTLYTSTNLLSPWNEVGNVSSPYETQPTNQMSFFFVYVEPTNELNSILLFNVDPNAENLRPTFTNLPALSYGSDGMYGLWHWSLINQQWE